MGLKEVLVSVKKGATRDGIEKNIPFLEKKFQPAFYTEKNLFQTLQRMNEGNEQTKKEMKETQVVVMEKMWTYQLKRPQVKKLQLEKLEVIIEDKR